MEEVRKTDDLNKPIEYNTTQFIVTKLGEEQYGIDIKYVDNIVRMQKITRVPKVPKYIKGVINIRGEIIPVVSLRLKMNLPEDEITKSTRIIILKLEQHDSIGILVDEVKEVVTLSDDSIEKMSYDKDERETFLSGVGKHDDKLISILELNSVLVEKE